MKFVRRKLKNGMIVILEKRDLPVVSLSVTNKFGAASEDSNIKGIAHLIEHMVFTGTKTRSHEDISREIEKKGGILNAFTANEVTSFLFKLPSEHIFAGLDIILDIIKNPIFDSTKFEKEKKVILEEIKMYHDDPSREVYHKILSNLYGAPFGDGILGSKETVSSLKRDFVFDYYKENYQNSDFIVSIVGNVDFEKVCDYLEKNFNFKYKKASLKKIEKINKQTIEERDGIDQAHFVFAMHAPLATDEKHYVLEVLDAYLADGMSSKLFLEIREKRGLAYSVQSYIDSEKEYSYYSIYAGTRKDALEDIKKIIIDEFEKIKDLNEKQLEESKERLVGLKKVSSEESLKVLNELTFMELTGKVEDYYKYEEKIRKVKLEQVKELAKEMIKKYSTAAIVPK